MKQGQPSLTAQGIALVRAMESKKPADQRVCYDPLAQAFVHPFLLWSGPFYMWYGARLSPGVSEYLIARTRYFDETLLAALPQGMQQLVILGAGYDSRAYRLPALRSLQHIFEVDHPATQAAKRRRLQQIGVAVPENVSYVPIDFMTQSLDMLFEYHYRADLKTFFLWEGVTYYLDGAAIDQTLAFVQHHACPGSVLLFDYVYTEALTSHHLRPEIARMRRYRRFTGEALNFGIPFGTIEAFLTERGFTGITAVTHTDLERLYFQGKTAARQVASVYAIVSASATGGLT